MYLLTHDIDILISIAVFRLTHINYKKYPDVL